MQEYVKQIENGERGSSSNRVLCNSEYTDGNTFTPNELYSYISYSENLKKMKY